VIAELLARNKKMANEVQAAKVNTRVYGDTAEEAATVAYLTWQSFAAQYDIHNFYQTAFGGYGELDERLGLYRDWYVEPLFDFLDETLDDANVVLATLIRYKQKVEWYRRTEVLGLYNGDTQRGEKNLKQHMFEFLFDQGLPFHVEPASGSGKPDVVSLDDPRQPFIGEGKIFDAESRGKPYVKKAFYQAYRYCLDYNEPLAYLIVFNVSNKQLRVEIPSTPDGVPRWEYNHKTIFLVVIDVHQHEGTASTLGVADTVTITAAELIHEVEEAPGQTLKRLQIAEQFPHLIEIAVHRHFVAVCGPEWLWGLRFPRRSGRGGLFQPLCYFGEHIDRLKHIFHDVHDRLNLGFGWRVSSMCRSTARVKGYFQSLPIL